MSNSATSSTHTNAFRNWSLIQRLHHPTFAGAKSGVDGIVGHDYMGSAEFEFGEVPKAWAQMRLLGARQKLVQLETPFKTADGKPFYIIASTDLEQEFVLTAVEGSGTRMYYTKESPYMDCWLPKSKDAHVFPGEDYRKRTVAWIALHAFVFWTVDKKLAARMWKELTAGYCKSPGDLVVGELVRLMLNDKQRNAIVKEIVGETVILTLSSDSNVVSVLYDEIYKPVRD